MATDYGQTEFDGLMGQMEHILTLLKAKATFPVLPSACDDNDDSSNFMSSDLVCDVDDSPDHNNADLPHTVSPPSPATSDNDFTNLIVPPPAMFLAILPSLPEETATSQLDILQNVSMPTKSRKRGRPKGSVTTAIGLPRATKKPRVCRPKGFHQKLLIERKRLMLQWFVDDRNIDRALKGYYHFKETEVEQVPENISSAARDESINMAVIEEYFEDEAKIALHHACRALKDLPWFCGECQSDLQKETFSISCDGCLNWFHGSCTKLNKKPKTKSWFCSTCTQV